MKVVCVCQLLVIGEKISLGPQNHYELVVRVIARWEEERHYFLSKIRVDSKDTRLKFT